VRGEVKVLHRQLHEVKQAPLPRPEVVDLIENYVAGLMRQARPDVRIVGDKLRVGWRGDTVAVEDVVALIALIVPEQLCKMLERRLPELPGALAQNERHNRIGELSVQCLELERKEESLILCPLRSESDRSAELPQSVAMSQRSSYEQRGRVWSSA
jgi:hypothetical protein